jgi:hypothetical protein
MKENKRKGKTISRRAVLPILGSSLLIPFLGNSIPELEPDKTTSKEEDFKTLLKPDGTAVKVRTSALKSSKIVKKNMSNKSFLNWLGRKL